MAIDRAKLEHALAVTHIVNPQDWSPETHRVVGAAAEAHLETLPRTVKVTAWAIIGPGGQLLQLRDTPPAGVAAGIERLVELSGEYEEPA